MQTSDTAKLKAEIDPKVKKGDFITLGEMIGVPQNTARMRYKRDDADAILAMKKIVDTRDQLIKSYSKQ